MDYTKLITSTCFALIFAFFLLPTDTFAQTDLPTSPSSSGTNRPSKGKVRVQQGTYQLEVVNYRGNPAIPEDLNQQIVDNRHATETTFVWLGTHLRLKILSTQEISNPTFQPLTEEVVWVTE